MIGREDIWYEVAERLDPDPVDFAKLAIVCKTFNKIFTSNAVWKGVNPYGITDGNIYQHFRQVSTPEDLEMMYTIWRHRYHNSNIPAEHNIFSNLYLYLGYLVCTAQGNESEPTIIDNKQLVMNALRLNDYVYFCDQIAPELLTDREVAIIAVSQHGCTLEQFGHFNNDKELVLAAVESGCPDESRPLEWASDELQDDYDIVLAACKCNGYSLECASERLREDKSIVAAAIAEEPGAITHAVSPSRETLLECIKRCPYALDGLSEELIDDEEVVTIAIKGDWHVISSASARLKTDDNMITKMIEWHPECCKVLRKFRGDREYQDIWVKALELGLVQEEQVDS